MCMKMWVAGCVLAISHQIGLMRPQPSMAIGSSCRLVSLKTSSGQMRTMSASILFLGTREYSVLVACNAGLIFVCMDICLVIWPVATPRFTGLGRRRGKYFVYGHFSLSFSRVQMLIYLRLVRPRWLELELGLPARPMMRNSPPPRGCDEQPLLVCLCCGRAIRSAMLLCITQTATLTV